MAINWLSLGSIYCLLAVGLSLLFGVMEIPNFAHGGVFTLAAYIVLSALAFSGSYSASIVSGIVLIGAIGVLLLKTVFSRLELVPMTDIMMLTFGLGMAIQGLEFMLWKADYQTLPSLVEGSIDFYGSICSNQRMIAIAAPIAAMTSLDLFLKRTNLGKAVQATQQDREAAKVLGINTELIYVITMAVSFGLVGLAAVLLCPIILLYPPQADFITLKTFAIIIFGGMGSIKGALISSYLVAFIETIVAGYISFQYKEMIAFVLLFAVVAIRPQGLLGRD